MYRFTHDQKTKIAQLKNDTVQRCKKCSGSGYIPVPEREGAVTRCECMVVFRYLVELVKSCIPQDYWMLSLEDLDGIDESYVAFVSNYLDNFDNAIKKGLGFVFLGPNGIGKTSMMCEVGKHAVVQGVSVRYFTLSSYITAIQKGQTDVVEKFTEGQVLLIDELDKKYVKRGSDFVIKTFDESMREFLGAGKAVFLCTNWSVEEVESVLGYSMLSLLKRRSEFLTMTGEDYSHNIQDAFWEDVSSDVDYMVPSIIDPAWDREVNCG